MIESLKKFLNITPEDLQKPVFTKSKGDVFYLILNTKANTFTKPFVRQIHAELDIIEANDGPTAMVTVSFSKMFSGGLDLKYISNLQNEDQRFMTLQAIGLFGRISVLPFPTFCLVRGAAVAAGCMTAFSHDYVYAVGKAMFSTNESQNQLHFPPGMLAVIKKRHPYPSALRDMIIFSKQFQAQQALQNKFIDGILSEEQAVDFVHNKASEVSFLGDNKPNMKNIKCELHKQVLVACFEKQMYPNTTGYLKGRPFPKL